MRESDWVMEQWPISNGRGDDGLLGPSWRFELRCDIRSAHVPKAERVKYDFGELKEVGEPHANPHGSAHERGNKLWGGTAPGGRIPNELLGVAHHYLQHLSEDDRLHDRINDFKNDRGRKGIDESVLSRLRLLQARHSAVH